MHVRTWGERQAGRPLVVLLHALGCHGGWWDWVGRRDLGGKVRPAGARH